MANIYGPSGQRRRPQSQQNDANRNVQGLPTLEDYQQLALAYQELQSHYQDLLARYETKSQQLTESQQELQIKNEALERQSADFKQVEAELVWNKAALQQAQQALEANEGEEEGDWQERYQRLHAEMENVRKRLEQRLDGQVVEARHRILLDMIPLADHLDLALQYADMLTDEAGKTFLGNIEATRSAFMDTLKRYDITGVGKVNEPFDPNLHEAMGEVENEDIAADHVAQVLQAGYVEGDKLLRPARVLVSKG